MTIPLYSIKHKVLPQTQCGREVAFIPRYPGGVIPSVWHLSNLALSAEKPCTREPWALGRSTECCPQRGQQPARRQRGAALPYRVKTRKSMARAIRLRLFFLLCMCDLIPR